MAIILRNQKIYPDVEHSDIITETHHIVVDVAADTKLHNPYSSHHTVQGHQTGYITNRYKSIRTTESVSFKNIPDEGDMEFIANSVKYTKRSSSNFSGAEKILYSINHAIGTNYDLYPRMYPTENQFNRGYFNPRQIASWYEFLGDNPEETARRYKRIYDIIDRHIVLPHPTVRHPWLLMRFYETRFQSAKRYIDNADHGGYDYKPIPDGYAEISTWLPSDNKWKPSLYVLLVDRYDQVMIGPNSNRRHWKRTMREYLIDFNIVSTMEFKDDPIIINPPKPYVPSPSIPDDNSPIHSFIHKDVKFYQDFISGSATASGELFIGNDITVEQVERMLNLATWYLFNPRRTVGLNREFAEADFHFDTPKTPLPENGDFSTVPNRDRDLRYRENHFAFLGNIPVFDKAEISTNPLLRKKMDAYVNWRTKNPSDNLEQLGTPGVNVTWINSRLMNVNRLVDRPKPISILGTIQHLDIERFDKVPSNNGEDQNFTSNEYTYQDKPLSVTELIRTIKYVAQRYSRIAKVEYGRSNLNKYQDYFFTTQSNDTIKNLIEQGIDALLVKQGDGERDLVPGEEVSMQKVWEFIVDVANVIYTVARDNAPIVNTAI